MWIRRVLGIAAAVGMVIPLTLAPAGAADARSVDVIVVLDDAASPRAVAADHRVSPRFVYEHALTGFAASVPEGRLHGLRNDPRVAFVSNDGVVQATAQTTPTGVSRIDAPQANAAGATGAGVRVAIIDTGIDMDHPDLAGNIDTTTDWDCVNNDADPDDDQGHGTHVAGTVAAIDNDSGVVGVAPAATLVAYKVLGSNGSGTWAQVVCGIDKAADPVNDIDVANMSLGGPGSVDGTCTSTKDAMYKAICSAVANGVSFVVAAGNDSTNASGFVPAAYPEVITVSAYSDTNGSETDAGCTGNPIFRTCDEQFASFSNYGQIVDVIAPGVNILSTTVGGGTGQKSGTSMASPHVAGLAALVLQNESSLTPAQMSERLRDTGQCPNDAENAGTGNCTGQGTWNGDPDSYTEPMGNAVWAVGDTGGGDEGGDTNTDPTADFTFSCTELTCQFTDASTDSDGSIASRSWTFGDGGTSTAQNPSHTYGSGGTFTVTLTVTDNEGGTDSTSQSVTVTAPDTGGFTLTATGYKSKGLQKADLTWGGATGTSVDVYRNGTKIATTANDGAHTDNIDARGGGTYTYQVCEAGTVTCSNEATVTF